MASQQEKKKKISEIPKLTRIRARIVSTGQPFNDLSYNTKLIYTYIFLCRRHAKDFFPLRNCVCRQKKTRRPMQGCTWAQQYERERERKVYMHWTTEQRFYIDLISTGCGACVCHCNYISFFLYLCRGFRDTRQSLCNNFFFC